MGWSSSVALFVCLVSVGQAQRHPLEGSWATPLNVNKNPADTLILTFKDHGIMTKTTIEFQRVLHEGYRRVETRPVTVEWDTHQDELCIGRDQNVMCGAYELSSLNGTRRLFWRWTWWVYRSD